MVGGLQVLARARGLRAAVGAMTASMRDERGSALFGVIVGFAAGVLVAALFVPARGSRSVLAGGANGTGGGSGTAGSGGLVLGPGEASGGEAGAGSGSGGAGGSGPAPD